MNDTSTPAHRWRFFRVGGFDQVRIDTPEDLVALGELDPKLWVALSCPVHGIEFDSTTLKWLDSDGDGQIRVPELIAAAQWVGRVLKDRAPLARGDGVLPLAAFNTDDADGKRLAAGAKHLLASLGKGDASHLTLADTADIALLYAKMRHNGDGLIPVSLAEGDDAAALQLIIDTQGAETDRGGLPGVDEVRIHAFFEQASALLAWHEKGSNNAAVHALGEATDAAATAFRAVRTKVDDFFTRCRLAAYDGKAASMLNPPEDTYAAMRTAMLNGAHAEIVALPLAAISDEAILPLTEGLNPAWETAVFALRDLVVKPIVGAHDAITAAHWQKISATLDAHEAWQAEKPTVAAASADIAILKKLATPACKDRLLALTTQDKAAADDANAIADLDKLLHYCRDLLPFANNFVSFREFYTGRKGIFQAGSLFLDGRSCDLTLKVSDAGKHSALAGLAGVFLVYCDCVRGSEKMTIAAAFTDGDSGQLRVGRNGVFWDRNGKDWNATITKLVEHPISIREAFWTPYRKIGRLVSEQMNKFAASKSDNVNKQLTSGVESKAAAVTAGAPATAATPPPPAPFDIAKFAGIFAAIGLAFGAIGTALAALVTGFVSLKLWQMPLVLFGVMLLVSGPAMLLAALKLHQRNIGPMLDANGWAINARARINIPFGTSLTNLPVLPSGAERSLVDPYAEKKSPWPWVLLLALLAAGAWYGWNKYQAMNPPPTPPVAADTAAPANTAPVNTAPATPATPLTP